MGYDLALFVERVDDNFLCAICHQCVKDAVTGCSHGHAFCAGCQLTDFRLFRLAEGAGAGATT